MKILNYDPEFSNTNDYKQGHPCMPADVFRMLICGPSNSGKQTSCCTYFTSCWCLTKFISSRKTSTKTSIRLFCKTLPQILTPALVIRPSKRLVMKSFRLKSFR